MKRRLSLKEKEKEKQAKRETVFASVPKQKRVPRDSAMERGGAGSLRRAFGTGK